jgi:hypothetical protein
VIEASVCNATDACSHKAFDRFKADPTMWYTFCPECRHECVSVRFDAKLSSVTAYTDLMKDDIKAFVESSGVPLPTNWSSTWPAEIQKNFVELYVECESLRVEHYNQTRSISPVDVLSNIGGQTGLWIGTSFLSLMELVEMAYRLIRYQYHVLRRKIQGRRRPT